MAGVFAVSDRPALARRHIRPGHLRHAGAAALLLVATFAAGNVHAGARAVSSIEVMVLASDEATARIWLDDAAAFSRLAGESLRLTRTERSGARVFMPERALDERERSTLLARLREHPAVAWAEPVPAAAEREFARSLSIALAGPPVDRIVFGPADPALRARAARGEPPSPDLVRDLGRVARLPLYFERSVSGGAYALRFFHRVSPATAAAVADRLAADPRIAWAEPAVRGRFQMIVDDPLLPAQWALLDPHAGIAAPEAWRLTGDAAPVTIAVLDSGVLSDHPDLAGRVLPGQDFVWDAQRAGDFDGRDGDATDPGDHAVKYQCDDTSPKTASSWHGTHVAGIAAAAANGAGIVGVAPTARILPVRVGAACGIDPIDLAEAIRWAAGVGAPTAAATAPNPHPARVLNLSLSFPGPCPHWVADAVAAAVRAGALVIAAAGNEGRSAAGTFPANCPGVLAVAATDATGGRAPYTNTGPVEIAAPGGSLALGPAGGIVSAIDTGQEHSVRRDWGVKEGTSMAAPHVAGVAALVLAVAPELRPGQLWNVLVGSARAFPRGTAADCAETGPASCGAGIVNAEAAVRAALARRSEAGHGEN